MSSSLPNEVQEALALLQQQLQKVGQLSVSLDDLLADLMHPSPPEKSEVDEDMLSFIVNDALRGEDISQRYPGIYRQILSNPALFEAFIETVDMLVGAPESVPMPSTRLNLDFLQTTTQPIVEAAAPNQLRILWQQTKEQLQRILFSISPEPIYRNSYDFLEDQWFTLLRSQVTVEDKKLDVFLEATQTVDEGDKLHPSLTLVAHPVTDYPDVVGWRATLRWGNYEAQALINQDGYTRFPHIQLEDIVDEVTATVKDNLHFRLEQQS